MSPQRILKLGAAVAFLMLIGCEPKSTAPKTSAATAPAAVSLRVTKPERGDVYRFATLPGAVAANQQTILYSKVAGYLKAIHVDKGDEVKEGQLIAEIEAPELKAEMGKFQAEAEIAELESKRATDAQKKAPDLVMIQTLDAAKAKSLTARANLEKAQVLMEFCRITAPFAGVVTRRTVDPGAFIPAATGGNAQNAAVVTIADYAKVRVQVAAPEVESMLVRAGTPCLLSFEGLPGKVLEATVSRTTQSLDETTKTMLAEIDLPNENWQLRPGMFATVKLGLEKHAGVLTLPTDAVVVEKAGAAVFKLVNGKAARSPVKLGFNDGTKYEVTEGVQDGDAVLLVGKTVVADGTPVTVVEAK